MNPIASTRAALVAGCALALFASARTASAAPAMRLSPAVRSAIAAAVEKERKIYGGRTPVPGMLVGVWTDAGERYVRAFGYADLAKRRRLTAADHFRIGSNTKTFVISVLLQLVDEGKLRLDDPLSRFALGVTIPNAKNITVREVCEMRSGLFEAFDTPELARINLTPELRFNPHTLVGWAVKQKPYFAPGKGYRYSNTNYIILGLLVDAVAKDNVANQIRRRLLVPFNLTHTSYPQSQTMREPWAHGYTLDSKRNWSDVSNTVPVSLMGSAGAMISDMGDMQRWVKLYVTGKTNGTATQRARLTCLPIEGNVSFGLGIACSAGWYGYIGGLPGYNTATFYNPSRGITVVAWVTLQRSVSSLGVAAAVFRDIARIITPTNVPYTK